MGVLSIRPAEVEGARLILGLCGVSGSGKTYTALQLAYGLANFRADKVGFLDTENRRGSLYANALKGERFLIGDLYPPFSPARYIDAVLEFQSAGVEVLVIDTYSHVWEGIGGCHDIAAAGGRVADWKIAKPEHRRFVNVLLQCNMHIIACVRARDKVEIKKQWNEQKRREETVVIPKGCQPICEQNFMFELTASLMMWEEGKRQSVLKCHEDFRPYLGRESGYITAADGKAIRDWVDGKKQLDPEVERARNTLRTVTEKGTQALRDAWTLTPAHIREALGADTLADLKAAAAAFDDANSRSVTHQTGKLNEMIQGEENVG